MRVDHKTIRVDHKKVWEKLSAPGLENAAIYSLWQDTAQHQYAYMKQRRVCSTAQVCIQEALLNFFFLRNEQRPLKKFGMARTENSY